MVPSDRPALSVVVAIVSDTTGPAGSAHLAPCLAALSEQTAPGSIEIVVPHLPSTTGISVLREQFPAVRFAEVPDLRMSTGRSGSREHHDELRARGLAIARGDIVALIEDHGIPTPDWCRRIIESHRQPFAVVGGAIENGIDRPLNWAVYYCDFLRYQNPHQAGASAFASDANVSYKRAALESIRPVWQEIFRESSVNDSLRSQGETVALAPEIVLHQHRLGLRLTSALKERYVWGRSYAAARIAWAGTGQRVFWAALSPALPALLLLRMTMLAFKKRRTFLHFLKALPLTAILLVSWACGEFMGYVTGRANSDPAQTAEAIARGSHATS